MSDPPAVQWASVDGARFYNVQLHRIVRGHGTKVLPTWLSATRLGLPRSWKLDGKAYRLEPGKYVALVWPAFGTRASPRYGPLLGQTSFTVAGKPSAGGKPSGPTV